MDEVKSTEADQIEEVSKEKEKTSKEDTQQTSDKSSSATASTTKKCKTGSVDEADKEIAKAENTDNETVSNGVDEADTPDKEKDNNEEKIEESNAATSPPNNDTNAATDTTNSAATEQSVNAVDELASEDKAPTAVSDDKTKSGVTTASTSAAATPVAAEEDDEEKEDELEEDEGQLASGSGYGGKKNFLGHTCSIKTLIDDGVLVPTDEAFSFEFKGKSFTADLLPNGSIRWAETKQVFTTPSSWVNHCKRTITTEAINKTVSAWSIIKYQGKRLDSYKLRWYRKQKKNLADGAVAVAAIGTGGSSTANFSNGQFDNFNPNMKGELYNSINANLTALYNEASKNNFPEDDPETLKEQHVVEHGDLPKKYVFKESDIRQLDCNQLVRAVSFRSIERIQPFTITVSTNALLLMDYHCHLTSSEVVGYLAGTWDIQTHMLNIVQAYPCKARTGELERARSVEEEIKQNLQQRNLSLVGWYHNHGDKAAQPSVKDIECQLEYQLAMRGNDCDLAYIPCVGFICAPYNPYNKSDLSSFLAYWVMPPSESSSLDYGKPMQMFYQITRDSFLTQDLLLEMRLLAHYYVNGSDAVVFKEEPKIENEKVNGDTASSRGKRLTVASDKKDITPETKTESEAVDSKSEQASSNSKDTSKPDSNTETEVEQQKAKVKSESVETQPDGNNSIEKMEVDEEEDQSVIAGKENGNKHANGDDRTADADAEHAVKVKTEKVLGNGNANGDISSEIDEQAQDKKDELFQNGKEETADNSDKREVSWEKLKASLKPNLPRDLQISDGLSAQQIEFQQQALTHFWAFLKGLLLNINQDNVSSSAAANASSTIPGNSENSTQSATAAAATSATENTGENAGKNACENADENATTSIESTSTTSTTAATTATNTPITSTAS